MTHFLFTAPATAGRGVLRSGRDPQSISKSRIGYTRVIMKRLVDIDDNLLERARSIAGTETIKDTVTAALQRLVDDETVLRHIERLRGSGALDLAEIESARRPRTAR